MRIKNIIALALATILLFSLTSCTNSSAEGAITSLFKALKTYDTEAITEVVTEFPNTNDCGVTYDLFSDEAYVVLFREAYGELTYSIDNIVENESSATVTLKMTHPDFKSAYSTAMYSVAALVFSDSKFYEQVMSDETADISYLVPQQMKNMYVNEKIETIETTYTLTLINDNGAWKINTDDQLKNLMSCNLYTITSTISNGGLAE